MVKFETSRFGALSVAEDHIINFKNGILGFPNLHRYVLLECGNTPLKWLHSVDDPQVAFVVADPTMISGEGTITVGDDILRFLQIEKEDDLAVLIMLRFENDKIAANLDGPIAINSSRMLGVQALLDRG